MAALLSDYLARVSAAKMDVKDPCFEFVAGWISVVRGQDARQAFLADGYLDPLRLQVDEALFLQRAQMIADRLGMCVTDAPQDGDLGLLAVFAAGDRICGAMAIRNGGLWLAKTAFGVVAGSSRYLKAWSIHD